MAVGNIKISILSDLKNMVDLCCEVRFCKYNIIETGCCNLKNVRITDTGRCDCMEGRNDVTTESE